jgi:hypothetical protein
MDQEVTITERCHCCWLQTISVPVNDKVRFCDPCLRHRFRLEETLADHRAMVEAHLAGDEALEVAKQELVDAHKKEVVGLGKQIHDLTHTIATDYRNRPMGDVQKLIEAAALKQYTDAADNAYRLRDKTMGAVWRLVELHYDVNGLCKCGKRQSQCEVYSALFFIRRDFEQWEARQEEKAAKGLHHGLPKDHPVGVKHGDRYGWKGLPSTRGDRHPY